MEEKKTQQEIEDQVEVVQSFLIDVLYMFYPKKSFTIRKSYFTKNIDHIQVIADLYDDNKDVSKYLELKDNGEIKEIKDKILSKTITKIKEKNDGKK